MLLAGLQVYCALHKFNWIGAMLLWSIRMAFHCFWHFRQYMVSCNLWHPLLLKVCIYIYM